MLEMEPHSGVHIHVVTFRKDFQNFNAIVARFVKGKQTGDRYLVVRFSTSTANPVLSGRRHTLAQTLGPIRNRYIRPPGDNDLIAGISFNGQLAGEILNDQFCLLRVLYGGCISRAEACRGQQAKRVPGNSSLLSSSIVL